jgi:hypothetical protein
MDRNFVVFTTELFLDEQADEELDQRFLGEDCARWLRSKLLEVEAMAPSRQPIEEDWGGWSFGIQADGVRFSINIWPGLEERQTWIVGIEPSPGLFGAFTKKRRNRAKARLCDAIESALSSTTQIRDHRWLDKHPLAEDTDLGT